MRSAECGVRNPKSQILNPKSYAMRSAECGVRNEERGTMNKALQVILVLAWLVAVVVLCFGVVIWLEGVN